MLYGIYSFYSPEDRRLILKNIKKSLNPGGCIVTEVFTEKHYANRLNESDWEYIENDGFWSANEYIELNSFYKYEQEKLVLIRAGIIEEENIRIWNSWIKMFDSLSIIKEFEEAGFFKNELYASCMGEDKTDDSEVIFLCSYYGG